MKLHLIIISFFVSYVMASGDALTMTNEEFYGKGITSNIGYIPLEDLEHGLNYNEHSQTLTWVGQINHLEYAKFSILGWNEKPIKRLIIRSGGGMTRVAWAMADFVKKNNVIVEVAKQCDSACALIALSSPKIEGWGTIGFHLPYLVPKVGTYETEEDFAYRIALLRIEEDVKQTIEFYKENKYVSDDLLSKIMNETSPNVLIDINVREFQ